MSKTHYEVEVWEHRMWLPLTDRKGKTVEHQAAKPAFDAKDVLPESTMAQVVQIFCKRTVIETLAMVQTK